MAIGVHGNLAGDFSPEAANESLLATDLLNGNNVRFHNMFRMSHEIFRSLAAWLKERADLLTSVICNA